MCCLTRPRAWGGGGALMRAVFFARCGGAKKSRARPLPHLQERGQQLPLLLELLDGLDQLRVDERSAHFRRRVGGGRGGRRGAGCWGVVVRGLRHLSLRAAVGRGWWGRACGRGGCFAVRPAAGAAAPPAPAPPAGPAGRRPLAKLKRALSAVGGCGGALDTLFLHHRARWVGWRRLGVRLGCHYLYVHDPGVLFGAGEQTHPRAVMNHRRLLRARARASCCL
jgi:hypothetical protein